MAPSDFGEYQGESSWLAVPFISRLPTGTLVLHQVRNPLNVVRSLVGIRFFSLPPARKRIKSGVIVEKGRRMFGYYKHILQEDFVEYLKMHCGEIFDCESEIARSVQYWVRWNQKVEEAAQSADVHYYRYRLEDVDDELLSNILTMLGERKSEVAASVEKCLKSVPRNINARRREESILWSDVLAHDKKGFLRSLTHRYGYQIEHHGPQEYGCRRQVR